MSLRSKWDMGALLVLGALTGLVLSTAAQRTTGQESRIVAVGPEVDVSSEPGVQSQVSIAIDPTDDRVLVAGSGNWGRKTRAYGSMEGGSTWKTSADPPLPAGVPQTCAFGDSTVAIDRLGRQYHAFIVGRSCDLEHLGSGVGAPALFVARRAGATAAWRTPATPVVPLYGGDALRHGEADDKPGLRSTSRPGARTPTASTSPGRAPAEQR